MGVSPREFRRRDPLTILDAGHPDGS
jgi:hypothetical protein